MNLNKFILPSVILCILLSGCASKELTQLQTSESKAMSEKQEADRQVEKAGNELEDAENAKVTAQQNFQQKIKLQTQANIRLKLLLNEKLNSDDKV